MLCNIVHNKTTCANSEGFKFMLSSLNNIVSNLHPQGVTHSSREWERSTSHAESTHPQGVARTSMERERSTSHVESSHSQGVARTSLERDRITMHTWRVRSRRRQGRRIHSFLYRRSVWRRPAGECILFPQRRPRPWYVLG